MAARVYSSAPTRVDLAGGTLDLWPLYLFLKHPLTVNAAISLRAECWLTETPGEPGVLLKTDDLKAEAFIPYTTLFDYSASLELHPGLRLHYLLARHFLNARPPTTRMEIRTRAGSPAGAGLGGSSALHVALLGALLTWLRRDDKVSVEAEGPRLIEITRDIETQILGVPAGLQDYYSAMYGGVQAIAWGVGTHGREALPSPLLNELKSRLLLFYSGSSRNSGMNNWVLFKDFIDQRSEPNSQLIGAFQSLSNSAHQVRQALLKKDWGGLGNSIQAEMSVRHKLAPSMSTPMIDQALQAASPLGYPVGKICGAGGGGCFLLYSPQPNPATRHGVIQALEKLGCKHLDIDFHAAGLQVQRNE